ncbi:MAG: BtpA/SgcQ family protein [Oscillospiraceae bacterium]
MFFPEIFSVEKPVMAMLHLKGNNRQERMDRCLREAEIYSRCGADAMIVEDYFGDSDDAEAALRLLSGKGYVLGVNILKDWQRSFRLADEYGARFIQIDSVSGHLRVGRDDEEFGEKIAVMRDLYPGIKVIGGVRFKYQPILSGRPLEADLRIGMTRCDAVAVTGTGTGRDTPISKLQEFRNIAGDFPLVAAAGVTPENAAEKLSVADAAIVGSTFKDTGKDTGEVSREKVTAFMDVIKQIRTGI